jgi:hypothetical protein
MRVERSRKYLHDMTYAALNQLDYLERLIWTKSENYNALPLPYLLSSFESWLPRGSKSIQMTSVLSGVA